MKKPAKSSNKEKENSYSQPSFNQQQSIQFKNNRPDVTTQLKFQEIANTSVQLKKNTTGLPNQLKSGIENLSGHSMDDVKVHYNSSKPAQLQAHAYAQGTDIHIASGQEKHLPHEAWHVVQQKQGRVQPTKQLKEKVAINDDAGLEKEADVMGAKALQMKEKEATTATRGFSQTTTIQRQIGDAYSRNTNDLVYGTHADRMHYEPQLGHINAAFGGGGPGGLVHAPPAINEPIIADFMNNLFLGTELNQAYGDQAAQTPLINPINTAFQDFVFFMHRYLSAQIPHGTAGHDQTARIAAACKFGIWLTAKQGRKIRFLLDDINTVPRQLAIANGGATQFTARELRFIRNSWNDKDIRNNIKFYANGAEVAPPWVTYATQWAAFHVSPVHGLALPQGAETEVQSMKKITKENSELDPLTKDLAHLMAERSEKLDQIADLSETIKELQKTYTPTTGESIKAFFGIQSPNLVKMKKNLKKAQALMKELKELIAEVKELTHHIKELNEVMLEKAEEIERLIAITKRVNHDKSAFLANQPPPLPHLF